MILDELDVLRRDVLRETLRSLARLAVPVLGNVCAIDIVNDDGTLQRVEMVVANE